MARVGTLDEQAVRFIDQRVTVRRCRGCEGLFLSRRRSGWCSDACRKACERRVKREGRARSQEADVGEHGEAAAHEPRGEHTKPASAPDPVRGGASFTVRCPTCGGSATFLGGSRVATPDLQDGESECACGAGGDP